MDEASVRDSVEALDRDGREAKEVFVGFVLFYRLDFPCWKEAEILLGFVLHRDLGRRLLRVSSPALPSIPDVQSRPSRRRLDLERGVEDWLRSGRFDSRSRRLWRFW